MLRATVTIAAALALSTSAGAQDWPRFRGANGSGVTNAPDLPTTLRTVDNYRWRTRVPFGTSSPVIAGTSIFLTGADERRLVVMCLDRSTGEVRWDRAIERDRTQEVYEANDSAAPSPTTDGSNVYAFFPEMGLISFDAEGVERWRLPLGPFESFYGLASSPIVAGSSVLLVCDQQEGSFLVCVDAATGQPRWLKERPAMVASWTTPLLYPSPEEPEQVITFGSSMVTGYAVETGEELWRTGGVGYAPVSSPVLVGDMLYVSAAPHSEEALPDFDFLLEQDANRDGFLGVREFSPGHRVREHFGWADLNKDDLIDREEWQAARDGANSQSFGLVAFDISKSKRGRVHEVWRHRTGLPQVATPLVFEDRVYLFKDGGVLTTLDAASGRQIKRARLDIGSSQVHASPVAGDGKVYLTTREGQVLVLEGGASWKMLGVSDLDEEIQATPALTKGLVILRTASALHGFGPPARR